MDFSIIPVPIIFIISVSTTIIAQTINAQFSKKNDGGVKMLFLRNTIFMFLIGLAIFALNGFVIKVSIFTLIMGLLFGLMTMLSNATMLQAYSYGPYGYTSVIVTLSTVITALSGYLFWGERFGIYKVIGITLMVFCFIFAVENKPGDTKKANLKWFIFSIASMLFSAVLGILQKIHQSSEYKGELTGFLVIAFLFSTLLYFIPFLVLKKQAEKPVFFISKKSTTNFILITVLGAIVAAICNCSNSYLAGVVDSAIMFPIVNGMPLMAGILVSFVLFKEKISKKQSVGLIIGLISIVFLCL